jgi:MFS family permease
MLYLVAFIQATVASIYDPVRRAIVPLLVTQEDYLQKATLLSGLAYSLMAAFGSSLGGIVASKYGVTSCFGTSDNVSL